MIDRRIALALVASLGACAGPEGDPGPRAPETIDADTLAARLAGADPPRIVDVQAREAYELAHIDGAGWVDEAELRASVDGVDGQLAPRSVSDAAFGGAGLEQGDAVVIVGADNSTDPARALWTLDYYGHRGSLALLDGGMAAWIAGAKPTQASVDDAAPIRAYASADTRAALRVDKAWMLDHLGDPEVAIFDVRGDDEFAAGHVPGAIHVEWTANLGDDGRFRGDAEIRALHGDPDAPTLITYCRTGSRAAVSWALLRRAGYGDVRLYDGSWSEWGADPETPKE